MTGEKEEFLHMRISALQKRQLEALAKQRGMTNSELVRKWITQAVNREAGHRRQKAKMRKMARERRESEA